LGKGRVIVIDIEIQPHNRKAIESHELFSYITLIEGSSTDKVIIDRVKSLVKRGESVLVVLDSNHSKQHVLDELNAYHHLVTLGSCIIATDGIMKDLWDVPRGNPEWIWDNPSAAEVEFVQKNPEFIIEQPQWPFKESHLTNNITH
jgi:cephalosporin hydroxylase